MAFLSGPTPEILPCPSDRIAEALALLYRRVPEAIRPNLIAESQVEAAAGTLDLSGLWIARRWDRIVGALLTQRLTPRTAAIWPPEVLPRWSRGALACALVQAGIAALADQGLKLVQAMVEETANPRAAADLVRGGLKRVTELTFLSRETALPLWVPARTPPMVWTTFHPQVEAQFAEVIESTYTGTLDMPELAGARSFADLVANHRAAGNFDPEHWFLGRVADDPGRAAILLLNAPKDRAVWDISYLGLTPSARGLGIGRAALAHALELARPCRGRLELAVDTRNHPARRLYRAAGFLPFDRRGVYLAVLSG